MAPPALRRVVTQEPPTTSRSIFANSPSWDPLQHSRLSDIDHLFTKYRIPCPPDDDYSYTFFHPVALHSRGLLTVRNPSPEPHDMPLPPSPPLPPQSPPREVRRPTRLGYPRLRPPPLERLQISQHLRTHGPFVSNMREYDLPRPIRPSRWGTIHRRRLAAGPQPPYISTTQYGQLPGPTRLTIPYRTHRGLGLSSNIPSHLSPYLSQSLPPLSPRPAPVLAPTPAPPLLDLPLLTPVSALAPEPKRQLIQVYALQVQVGDILKCGNKLNDGCTVTQCYPEEERRYDSDDEIRAPPIRLHRTIRIQWKGRDDGEDTWELFRGLDELEVLRVVDEEKGGGFIS